MSKQKSAKNTANKAAKIRVLLAEGKSVQEIVAALKYTRPYVSQVRWHWMRAAKKQKTPPAKKIGAYNAYKKAVVKLLDNKADEVAQQIDWPRKDVVNSPSHYKKGGIECIDAIRSALSTDEFRGFCKGTALAYIWRLGHKDAAEIDAAKTEWYVSWLKGIDPRVEGINLTKENSFLR